MNWASANGVRRIPLVLSVAVTALAIVIGMSRIGLSQDDSVRALRQAIDIHVHSDPDNVPRSLDGLEVAKLARSKGLRGIVLKNHYDPTAGLAFLARKGAQAWRRLAGSTSTSRSVG